MITLGIDPGTQRVGYGIVKREGGKTMLVACGLLKIGTGPALLQIKKELEKLIKKFSPEIMAVEKLYFVKNQKTAMQVAESRGVIILTALESGLKIKEYAPNEAKGAITGYGLADKKSVLKMVRLILKRPDLAVIDDASDALALAILASNTNHGTDR